MEMNVEINMEIWKSEYGNVEVECGSLNREIWK